MRAKSLHWVSGLLLNNFGWKLLALIIAAGLWALVVGDTELAAGISVPIQFKNVPPDLEISSYLPEKVNLELRGPSRKMRPAELAGAVCLLDLSQVKTPGERTFTLRTSQVNLPVGVQMVRAIPSQLQLHFEHRVSREVPVRLRLENGAPQGLRVADTTIRPDLVRIIGPESRVAQVDSVQTDPINLNSAGADTEFKVHVFANNPQVRLESASTVTVRIILAKIPDAGH
jgi:YbbR domain-containing protein